MPGVGTTGISALREEKCPSIYSLRNAKHFIPHTGWMFAPEAEPGALVSRDKGVKGFQTILGRHQSQEFPSVELLIKHTQAGGKLQSAALLVLVSASVLSDETGKP